MSQPMKKPMMSSKRLPDETDADYESRKQITQNQVKQMTTAIKEMDQLTLGWAVDQKQRSSYLDMHVAAVPGTNLAKSVAGMSTTTSAFTGFLMPTAAVTANFSGKMQPEDIQQALSSIAGFRARVMKEIDKKEELKDEQTKAAVKEIAGGLFDSFETTIKSGKSDGGLAVVLSDSPKFVAGGYVADSSPLEKSLKKLEATIKQKDPNAPSVKYDADQHAGVRFHTLSVPVPQDKEKAKKLFGEKLDIAIGIGSKSVYLAAGPESLALVKKVIDQSAAGMSRPVVPAQLNISLATIMQFAATVDPSPIVGMLAA